MSRPNGPSPAPDSSTCTRRAASSTGVRRSLCSRADISARARLGGDADCRQAVDLFFGFLGSVAGDLALTLGARGGVYIAGGIVVQLGDLVAGSSLRERFEAKGRYRAYLEAIPTSLIVDASGLALRGADAALDA